MTVRCAWCSTDMGETADMTPPISGAPLVSHGICAACDAKLAAELDAPEAA